MPKRIFIAFDLPKSVVEGLKRFRAENLPVNWTKPENLHVTLSFLGQQEEADLPQIFRLTEELSREFPPQELELLEARAERKMIWVRVFDSPLLARLQTGLQDRFLSAGLLLRQGLRRSFHPHICLARSRTELTDALYPPRRIGLKFAATHLVVFESILRPDYPRYVSLDAFELTGKS